MRPHDIFTFHYGWRTAPEQWRFYWNGKPLQLENDVRSTVACLILSGKKKEAEDILKRLLRKQEKDTGYALTYGFYGEDTQEVFYAPFLNCRHNASLSERLVIYKRWKEFIRYKGCFLEHYQVVSGHMQDSGKMSEGKREQVMVKIDLKRPCRIRLPREDKIFQF